MPTSSRDTGQPPRDPDQRGPERESKHWIEYATLAFVVVTAAAALIAAYYTRQQWLTSVDNEQRTLRAYVSVSGDDGLRTMADTPIRVWAIVHNTGGTPAFNVQVCTFQSILDYPLRKPYSWPPCRRSEDHTDATIGPHSSAKRATELFTLRQSEIDNLKTGGFRLYGYGTVYYTDAFGHDRFADYCFSYADAVDTGGKAETCDAHVNGN